MTVQSTTATKSYLGNGVTKDFPVPFRFLDDTHLVVTVVDSALSPAVSALLVLNSDYTLTGAGSESGGTLTTTGTLTNTQTIQIDLDPPLTQLTSYPVNGPFPAKTHEAALDQLTMIAQSLHNQVTSLAAQIAAITFDQTGQVTGRFTCSTTNGSSTLTITNVTSGAVCPGQVLSGTGIPTGATVLALGTSTGGTGTVVMSAAATANGTGVAVTGTGTGFITSAGALNALASTTSTLGDALVAVKRNVTGAVSTNVGAWIEGQTVNAQTDFGAKGDGTTDDTSALQAMFATGRPWFIPYTPNGYLISGSLVATASGRCEGQLIAKTGFTGSLVTICNPVYGSKLTVYGLNCYSTDVRPSPYTASKTVGIKVGPTATYLGNTGCPGVTLINCRATRFSIGLHLASFNIDVIGGSFQQNDHNILVYSEDTSYNQVNDISLLNVQADSAMSSVGQAYGLRLGTTGNGTYTGNANQGTNFKAIGCNFDGAPVYLDNMYGLTYLANYHEQSTGYTYLGGAVVLGSAGVGYLQNIQISSCWFTNFDYAIDVVSQCNNLEIRPNSYGSIKYSALRLGNTESQTCRYWPGVALGSTSWSSGKSEVLTNFGSGISVSQLTFAGLSHAGDYLSSGSQLAPGQAYTTNWYPKGMTNDGWQSLSSVYGRFRSGAAIQSSIAGTQAGTTFTFTTPAQALLFNGGDRITASAGSASFIKSVNYAAGTAVLDSSYSGSITISHDPAVFVGYNLTGNGSPHSVVTANPGSRYVSLSGGAGTTLYIKESGTGTNTGWVAK
jgi:hypothetical protein